MEPNIVATISIYITRTECCLLPPDTPHIDLPEPPQRFLLTRRVQFIVALPRFRTAMGETLVVIRILVVHPIVTSKRGLRRKRRRRAPRRRFLVDCASPLPVCLAWLPRSSLSPRAFLVDGASPRPPFWCALSCLALSRLVLSAAISAGVMALPSSPHSLSCSLVSCTFRRCSLSPCA